MISNQIIFRVPDMTCHHCVKMISQAIESAIEGAHVSADLANHTVTVSGTNDAERIAALVTAQDYSFEPL